MKLSMANNPEEEERRPIAREGEWSAYMDENYNRIYYFNHESVSSLCACHMSLSFRLCDCIILRLLKSILSLLAINVFDHYNTYWFNTHHVLTFEFCISLLIL